MLTVLWTRHQFICAYLCLNLCVPSYSCPTAVGLLAGIWLLLPDCNTRPLAPSLTVSNALWCLRSDCHCCHLCNSFHFLTYHFVRVWVGAAGVPATGVATREATIPYGAAESGRVPSEAACGTAADDGATTATVSAAGYCTRPGSVACSSIDTYSTYVFLLAAHSIVVRMLVSTGKLSPSFARLV